MKKTNNDRVVINEARVRFPALSENESFSRVCVSGFIVGYGITAEELADIRTSVSEAVTNCVVHGYRSTSGEIAMTMKLYSDGELYITVTDKGCGIEDVKKAREPLYTTDPGGDRCGMGFSIMESFMTRLSVSSAPGRGTKVTMMKKLSRFEKK